MRYLRTATAALALLGLGCTTATRTNTASPTTPTGVGVIVMAHGGSPEWNSSVRAAVEPIAEASPTSIAFGMADPKSLQASVDTLESIGVTTIYVVRLFLSGESFLQRTEYLFGLRPDQPGSLPDADPLRRRASVVVSEHGLVESQRTGTILRERAEALSSNAANESVLIIAHGMGDADHNAELLLHLDALADSVRAAAFHSVHVATLREDWAEHRGGSERQIRQFVSNETEDGRAVIVIPFRLSGFGPYAEVLEGLPYLSDGRGLIPHPAITDWIRDEIAWAGARPPHPTAVFP